MANSHQRKVLRKADSSALQAEGRNGPEAVPQNRTERMHRFLEHGSLQTLFGIAGGLMGTFLDGRYFALLGLWVPYSLYRTHTLEGLKLRIQIATHVAGVLIGATLFFLIGCALNKSRPHVFTPTEYKDAMKNGSPLPIVQQITNVYQTYLSPPKLIGEPHIDLSEFVSDGIAPDGGTLWHTTARNNGAIAALDVQGSTKGIVGAKGPVTEKTLFDALYKGVIDKDQPRADLPPGEGYDRIEPTKVDLSVQDRANIQSGNYALYLGRIDTYQGTSKQKYVSEICMYYQAPANTLSYCDGHNKVRKIP